MSAPPTSSAANAEAVVEVPVDEDGAFIDVDTRDALELLELHMIAERSGRRCLGSGRTVCSRRMPA